MIYIPKIIPTNLTIRKSLLRIPSRCAWKHIYFITDRSGLLLKYRIKNNEQNLGNWYKFDNEIVYAPSLIPPA